MEKQIHVGFGEFRISSDPESVLVSFGLGSCVAVGVYDPVRKIGGMIHVVLPSGSGKSGLPGKYADRGIPLLIKSLTDSGAKKNRMIVKMAGGAKILKLHYALASENTGDRNVAMCEQTLARLGLCLHGAETGGTRGRTVRLHIGTGKMIVRGERGESGKEI